MRCSVELIYEPELQVRHLKSLIDLTALPDYFAHVTLAETAADGNCYALLRLRLQDYAPQDHRNGIAGGSGGAAGGTL